MGVYRIVLCLGMLGFLIPHAALSDCGENLERLPIQAAGRVKPLRVHAKDVLTFISGSAKCGGVGAVQSYCDHSLSGIYGNDPSCDLQIKVNHVDTRRLLGMKKDETHIDPDTASRSLDVLRYAYADLENQKLEKSAAGKDLAATISKITLYSTVVSGDDWLVPVVHGGKTHWVSVRELYEIKKAELGDAFAFTRFLHKLDTLYLKEVNGDHLLELVYDKLQLFSWAMLATFLAIFAVALSWAPSPFPPPSRGGGRVSAWAIGSVSLVFTIEIAAIVFRVVISGRGPVTNMYETVMWVGLGALLFASILSILRKEKVFVLCGLGLNLLCLLMINFAHSMLDPSIAPLVPVLRDNFWLSTHVTTVTISYAAFALSWGLANYFMIKSLLGTARQEDNRYVSGLVYDAIKIGVVLIALGVILGGIWADYSWGRFWGWDPKETWALIVLMSYIAILHGRHAGWIRERQFIPLVGFAFLTVIMAWFGVNYILATGLHSYGFSEGGTIFIAALVLIQLIVLGLYVFKTRRTGS